MNVWLVLIGAGLVTFSLRLAFILLIGRVAAPEGLSKVLRFVPPSVLGAIIFLGVLMPDGVLILSPRENGRIITAGLAVIVAWRTKKILPTIGVGMISFWILQAVLAE